MRQHHHPFEERAPSRKRLLHSVFTVVLALAALGPLAVGASTAAESTAEELYARIEDRLAHAGTFEEPIARLILLESATEIPDAILERHPDSVIAAKLVLGDATTRKLDTALADARAEVTADARTCDTAVTSSCVLIRAFDLRERMGETDAPYGWFADMARAMQAIGLLEMAFDYAAQEPDGDLKAEILAELVIDLARSGRFDEARERADAVRARERVRVLAELAVHYYEAGRHRTTEKILASAEILASEQRQPAHGFNAVAAAWTRTGLGGKFGPISALKRAERFSEQMDEPRRSTALAHLAEAQADLGNGDDARRLLDALAEPNPLAVLEVHLTLAQHHAKHGDTETARAAYEAARKIAQEEVNWGRHPERWVEFLVRQNDVRRALGLNESSRSALNSAKDWLVDHDNPDGAIGYLIELARRLSDNGDGTAAAEMIDAAEAVLGRVDAPDRRHHHRGELIVVTAGAGELKTARQLAARASAPFAAGVLMRRARAHAEAGNAAEALATAVAIDDTSRRAQALLRIVPALP